MSGSEPILTRLYRWQHDARGWIVGRGCALAARGAGAQPAVPRDPRRILVVLTGLIGDSVMSTPVLIEARRRWPAARITVLGVRHHRDLLAGCPHLDDLIVAEAFPFSMRRRAEVAQLRMELAGHRFDIALIVLGDQFASLLREAGVPVRVGPEGIPLEPCLTHTYALGEQRAWGPHERLNALRVLGGEVGEPRPGLWVDDECREGARGALEPLGLSRVEPFAVLHPYGRLRRQWWPLERVKPLAEALADRLGLRSVLVGGAGQPGAGSQGALIDAVGRLSLRQLMGSIDQAALVVTTDSGPYHMAGALRRPTIGLFRAARPEYADLYASARVILGADAVCAVRCDWLRCRVVPCQQLSSIATADIVAAASDYSWTLAAARDASSIHGKGTLWPA